MATWMHFCRTQQGKNLDLKLMGGETPLTITKAMSGGERVSAAQLTALTALPSPKQQLTLSDRLMDESIAQMTLPILLTNAGLSESYRMYTLGIYAQDPDLGEILYMVSQTETEEGEEIPAETQQPAFSVQWNLCIKVSDAENITVEVPQAGVLTEAVADRRYAKLIDMETLSEALADKAEKPTTVLTTLAASAWNQEDKTYSFETEYPAESFDLSVEPDSTCTEAQLDAWSGARIVGSSAGNVLKAYGDVPAVDVPVILGVREK